MILNYKWLSAEILLSIVSVDSHICMYDPAGTSRHVPAGLPWFNVDPTVCAQWKILGGFVF